MGSLFKPKTPDLPAPPPPIPQADDPAIAAERTKLRLAERKRKGRGSTIVTGGRGVTTDAPLNQPAAGGDNKLGA